MFIETLFVAAETWKLIWDTYIILYNIYIIYYTYVQALSVPSVQFFCHLKLL